MKTRTSLIVLLMAGLMIAGCQNDPGPVQPINLSQSSTSLLGQMILPAGAELVSARLSVYVNTANNETIYIHRITGDWTETGVTWTSFGGAFDATEISSFVADGTGRRSADVTALVQGWLDGDYPNYGLLLDQHQTAYPRAIFHAREFSDFRAPFLEITYSDGVTVVDSTIAIADAYIWQVNPNTNYGTGDLLYTGWLNETDLEKQSLIRFEIEYEPVVEDGCTRTIGYWKNWSGFGPQPDMVTQYLPIWLGNSGGGSSIPVNNADTAVQVLSMSWDSPKNGIIKLYAQLLGAKLNFASGADDSDVADVVDDADDFLATHGWMSWYSLSKTQQKMVLGWMETLDLYNNGEIGPGHCDDGGDYDD